MAFPSEASLSSAAAAKKNINAKHWLLDEDIRRLQFSYRSTQVQMRLPSGEQLASAALDATMNSATPLILRKSAAFQTLSKQVKPAPVAYPLVDNASYVRMMPNVMMQMGMGLRASGGAQAFLGAFRIKANVSAHGRVRRRYFSSAGLRPTSGHKQQSVRALFSISGQQSAAPNL